MTNQTPESVIAEVIEYHADTIGSHYDGCHKHHAVCLAVKLRDMLREPGVPDAATELTAIKARSEEVNEDEGWHIGGAWGDYGEVVVPLRILSYVVDGALDEKIVSTDPGYAATYAEQVARADHAEAERDAALAAVERVRAIHMPFTHPQFPGDRVYCKGCAVAGRGEKSWPCETRAALDGAPEPEEKR